MISNETIEKNLGKKSLNQPGKKSYTEMNDDELFEWYYGEFLPPPKYKWDDLQTSTQHRKLYEWHKKCMELHKSQWLKWREHEINGHLKQD